MNYYSYDQYTGAYAGSDLAHENPRPDEFVGAYLLPAFATFDEPPVEEGKSAYFVDGAWELRDTPTIQAAAEFVGKMAPKEDKVKVLRDMTDDNIDRMAQSLGFANALDILSYDGEESQRGNDAKSFRAWRSEVKDTLDKLIAKYAEPDIAFVLPNEYVEAFRPIQMIRVAYVPETDGEQH